MRDLKRFILSCALFVVGSFGVITMVAVDFLANWALIAHRNIAAYFIVFGILAFVGLLLCVLELISDGTK